MLYTCKSSMEKNNKVEKMKERNTEMGSKQNDSRFNTFSPGFVL